jgi:hypothetical protein
MNILFIGDISGRPGRDMISMHLSSIKNENNVDFVIANAENAAGGRGITRKVLEELSSYGIDYFTSGEHVWSYKEFLPELNDEKLALVRPFNYEASETIPGKGYDIIDFKGHTIVIMALLGQTFMRGDTRNPFWFFDEVYDSVIEDLVNPIIIVDFHAEATSEKITFGNYIKDRVTAMCGTHTHVPTADGRIIGQGTGYITDVGMVGPLEASLWVDFESVTHNFKFPFKKSFKVEYEGNRVLNSVLLEVDDITNTKHNIRKCKKITRIDKYSK